MASWERRIEFEICIYIYIYISWCKNVWAELHPHIYVDYCHFIPNTVIFGVLKTRQYKKSHKLELNLVKRSSVIMHLRSGVLCLKPRSHCADHSLPMFPIIEDRPDLTWSWQNHQIVAFNSRSLSVQDCLYDISTTAVRYWYDGSVWSALSTFSTTISTTTDTIDTIALTMLTTTSTLFPICYHD